MRITLCGARRLVPMVLVCFQQYRVQTPHVVIGVLVFLNSYCFLNYNIWEYLQAEPFANFRYPLDVDLPRVVKQVQGKLETGLLPVSDFKHPFILNAELKCRDEEGLDSNIFLVLLIKSKLQHFERRRMIRRTWGLETAVPYIQMRRVFLLGVDTKDRKLQHKIGLEHQEYADVVQQFFADTYYNNTLKIMMGMKWAIQYCPSAQFAAVVDDDYYVNTFNVVRMLQKLKATEYPNTIIGIPWRNAEPVRDSSNPWYISVEEYPYRYFPPYPTAGSFFLHMEAVERLHIGMLYTRYLRFDDVFIGIVAWKLKFHLKHEKQLYTYPVPYDKSLYSDVIAVHGYDDAELLFKVWKEQFQLQQSRFKHRFKS